MPSAVADKFYHTKRWQKCRKAYIARRIAIDGGLCEVCHEELGYIVHHKIWIDETNINNPEVTLNHSNLRYECLACHNQEERNGGRRLAERENRYVFDANGDIVPIADGQNEGALPPPLKNFKNASAAHRRFASIRRTGKIIAPLP